MSLDTMRSGRKPIDVGILGATGMVGQQFLVQLAEHPWFTPTWLAASDRSAGRPYQEACTWRLAGEAPAAAHEAQVEACVPGRGPRLIFSALDAAAADDLEPAFAAAGHIVVSNARSFRMQPDVPLLIPEINADHLALLGPQREARQWRGGIVTNPNCSTVVLAMVLAPLRQFGIESVVVTTMQAVSGAGYPGVASFDIIGNVVPFISGEEEKMESEAAKILGRLNGNTVVPHPMRVSAHTNRVAVLDGHTETISVALATRPSPDDVTAALTSFVGQPQQLGLPSAPPRPVVVSDRPDRPQPRRDVERDGGMAVTVGRVRPCPVLGCKLVALGHNTIRGAAGAAVLNAELMLATGILGED